MTIAGKHVVISGGGTGAGAAMARAFGLAGARVTILGRRAAPLEELARQTGALPLVCDVTLRDQLAAVIADAVDRQGPVSVAVANAGIAPSAPFERLTPQDLDSTLSVNVGGVVNLWQTVLLGMKAVGWGRLIAVASTAGLKGYPYVTGYVASKHAVIGLTRSLALELGASGVTANAICPGFMASPMTDAALEKIEAATGKSRDAALSALLAGNPQRRLVRPEEVADTALWLCGPGAASVNGHALALSGGEV